mgnify:CR=1 FL=1
MKRCVTMLHIMRTLLIKTIFIFSFSLSSYGEPLHEKPLFQEEQQQNEKAEEKQPQSQKTKKNFFKRVFNRPSRWSAKGSHFGESYTQRLHGIDGLRRFTVGGLAGMAGGAASIFQIGFLPVRKMMPIVDFFGNKIIKSRFGDYQLAKLIDSVRRSNAASALLGYCSYENDKSFHKKRKNPSRPAGKEVALNIYRGMWAGCGFGQAPRSFFKGTPAEPFADVLLPHDLSVSGAKTVYRGLRHVGLPKKVAYIPAETFKQTLRAGFVLGAGIVGGTLGLGDGLLDVTLGSRYKSFKRTLHSISKMVARPLSYFGFGGKRALRAPPMKIEEASPRVASGVKSKPEAKPKRARDLIDEESLVIMKEMREKGTWRYGGTSLENAKQAAKVRRESKKRLQDKGLLPSRPQPVSGWYNWALGNSVSSISAPFSF